MFENFRNIFKRVKKKDLPKSNSKDMAKERLHLVLMQDRVNVSADFLDLMRVEMVEVLKKYIEIDEREVDIRLTTEINEKGEQSVPALYANIPIIKIKEDTRNLKKNGKTETISMEFLNIEGEKGEKQKVAEVKKDDVLEKNEKQEEKQPEENKKTNINEEAIKEQMREKLKTEEKDVSKEENQNAEKVEEKEKQEQENIEEKAKQEENEKQEEVKKEPEPEIKPESEPEAKTEPETEAKPETKSETKVEEKKSNKKSKKKSQEKNKNKKDVKEENSNEE